MIVPFLHSPGIVFFRSQRWNLCRLMHAPSLRIRAMRFNWEKSRQSIHCVRLETWWLCSRCKLCGDVKQTESKNTKVQFRISETGDIFFSARKTARTRTPKKWRHYQRARDPEKGLFGLYIPLFCSPPPPPFVTILINLSPSPPGRSEEIKRISLAEENRRSFVLAGELNQMKNWRRKRAVKAFVRQTFESVESH